MVGFTPPPCDAGVIGATPAFPAALSERRKRLTLAATILGSSMAFIDGSVVNIALPARPHCAPISSQTLPSIPYDDSEAASDRPTGKNCSDRPCRTTLTGSWTVAGCVSAL
jgi:hypothetical protein